MTTFSMLYTAFLCLASLCLLFLGLFHKDPQQGTRYSTVSIALFTYAILRVVMYFIIWLLGLGAVGGACSFQSL
jgi:hypothetical protein